MWDYLLSRRTTITIEYLPSKPNIIADTESKEKVHSSEWKLDPKVFQGLVQLMENPVVDLFASRLNHQLSPFSQSGTDAMHEDWSQNYLYAFPSFLSYKKNFTEGRARKNAKHVVDNTNIAHLTLLSIPSSNIYRNTSFVPRVNSLFKDPLGKEHPLITNKTLRLAAWKISGTDYCYQGFREQLPVLLLTQGEVHLQEIMNRPRESGLDDVAGDKLIQFRVIQTQF